MTIAISTMREATIAPVPGLVIGYLRESRETRRQRGLPREQRDSLRERDMRGQRLAIRGRVGRDGLDPEAVQWRNDWNRSGATGTRRPSYDQIKADMATGAVDSVYAAALSRFGRNVAEFERFWYLAKDHGIRLVVGDYEQGALTDLERPDALYPLISASEGESRAGRVRAARQARPHRLDTIDVHRSSCTAGPVCPDTLHHDGQPPFGAEPGEDVGAVILAFREAGTYSGAARLLTQEGVATRAALRYPDDLARPWESTTVMRIIGFCAINGLLDGRLPASAVVRLAREARMRRANTLAYTQARAEAKRREVPLHTLLAPRASTVGRRGRRPIAVHAFARLVRCPHHYEDVRLTATWRTSHGRRSVGLFCRLGRTEPGHPKPYSLPERTVRGWTQAVTATILGATVDLGDSDIGPRVASLNARLDLLQQAHDAGFVPDSDYRRQQADIEAEIDRLAGEKRQSVTFRLGIDWTRPPAELNAALLDLLRWIELDPTTFRPVAVVWTRQPVTGNEDLDGNTEADPDAEPVPGGGWRMTYSAPDSAVTRSTTS